MVRALLYLRLTSLRNFGSVQIRRLRQPKYLIGAIVAAAYFWFFFARRGTGSVTGIFAAGGLLAGASAPFCTLLLSFFLLVLWLAPGDEPGIAFAPAEIAFLFPAPWPRRFLIRYKILSALLGAALSAVIFAALFTHRRLADRSAPLVIAAWFLVLGILNLHRVGASLTLTRLFTVGMRSRARRRALLGLLFLLIVCTGYRICTWPPLAGADSPAAWLAALCRSTPLRWCLFPAWLVVAPFFAVGSKALAIAFGAAFLILALHAFWVLKLETPFEEASVVQAERNAAKLAALRETGRVRLAAGTARRRPDPFNLARAPAPECAFLWKNLLSSGRLWLGPGRWLLSALAMVALSFGLQALMGHSYWKAGAPLATMGFLAIYGALVYGPLVTRLDLRQDLPNLDLLRTYPLPGWRIMLGQLLAPTVVLTSIFWLGLLAWFLGLYGHQPPKLPIEWFNPAMRIVIACCGACLAPEIVLALLIVPNGAATLFPTLLRPARTGQGGIDQMGQRIIFGLGQVIVLILALTPAGFMAFLLIFATQWLIGPGPALMLGCAAAAVVLAGEIAVGIWWLGERFEKIDLSA